MSDDIFADLVPNAQSMLAELAQNNTRDWFHDQKPRYDTQLKQPATALLDVVSADLGRLTGRPVTSKLFRAQRDIRFSKDKTPYHTHLHLMWTTPTNGAPLGWFFGVSPNYLSIGAGVMAFDKTALLRWRKAIDAQNPVVGAIHALTNKDVRLEPPTLKRVPAPYAKDHPQEALLRHKGLSLWITPTPSAIEKDGLIGTIMAAFSKLLPVQDALDPLL